MKLSWQKLHETYRGRNISQLSLQSQQKLNMTALVPTESILVPCATASEDKALKS